MQIYKQDFSVSYKDDASPLTQADLEANRIICESLQQLFPEIPILSEENKTIAYEERKDWEFYWCIDPIDGTKEFVKKNGEFTINIALIEKDTPVLGVVYAPALGVLYSAKKKEGAFKNAKKLKLENSSVKEVVTVVASKSHMNEATREFIEKLKSSYAKVEVVSIGSSLKLCLVAEGSATLYPRLSPTMEWDTVAADAIVREAGKMTYALQTNTPLKYNKETLQNPHFIVR
jgi:3'(2'), 5'-bisphosphate nucleotidase